MGGLGGPLATRLASVPPAAKADDMDKALAITEMAKAFAVYPATVAHWPPTT